MGIVIVIDVLGGFVLLFVGAEVLVRGASRLAALLGIPPVIVGLTVVAFGTSAPELAVSALSASRGASGIAVGNVIGSNIFNILAILGLVALLRPLRIHSRVVWRDVPVMVGVSGLAFALAWNGAISRLEGGLLLAGLALFLLMMRRASADEPHVTENVGSPARVGFPGVTVQVASVVAGLFLLVIGSRWLVRGATEIASALGFSDLLIGLTLVAAGTSLPELATSVVAALRRHEDIAVGNVVGSNVFNLLGVFGISALVSNLPLQVTPESLRVDFPVMIAAAVLCLVFFASGRSLARSEGAFLLVCYGWYTAYLFLDASGTAIADAVWTGVLASLLGTLVWVIWVNRAARELA